MIKEDLWRIYQDKENVWLWKKMDPAGKVLISSKKGYKNRSECLENARQNGFIGN